MKKSLFCAHCQTVTEHTFSVAKSPYGTHELLSDCDVCHRVLKFDANASPEDLKAAFEAHAASNQGQIPSQDHIKADEHPVLKVLESI
ncbi:MAG: hypothetical protein NVS1B11_36260 [Terriglobales bacterium]